MADVNRRMTICITITSQAQGNLHNWGLGDSAHRLSANKNWAQRLCSVGSGLWVWSEQRGEAELMCFLLYVERHSLINMICIHCLRKCQKSTDWLRSPGYTKTQVVKGHILHYNTGIQNLSIWNTENCCFFGSHFISHYISLPFWGCWFKSSHWAVLSGKNQAENKEATVESFLKSHYSCSFIF